MRTPIDIYTEYRIMPNLQLHQLRVAAVAKTICDNALQPVDRETTILAALFHDMGNILKFNLDIFPEFLEPEGRAHWELVKDEYVNRYGTDHHAANAAIAKEIGLPEKVVRIIAGAGFSDLEEIFTDGTIERKICKYSDLRVGPHGVLSLEKRIEEGRERYARRPKDIGQTDLAESEERFNELTNFAKHIEGQIFVDSSIAPEDVTEDVIAPVIEELRTYPIFS